MPTYDYKCDEGHEVVVQQSIKEDALTRCIWSHDEDESPLGCGAPCQRLISKASFKFKGGSPTPKYHS